MLAPEPGAALAFTADGKRVQPPSLIRVAAGGRDYGDMADPSAEPPGGRDWGLRFRGRSEFKLQQRASVLEAGRLTWRTRARASSRRTERIGVARINRRRALPCRAAS